MKAWQFTNTHEPLVLNEIEEPKAGPGQVVIEMKAAGLCHSDVGLLEDEGWLSTLAKRPITIGHENAGVVVELGEGVMNVQVGDRVSVCPTTPAGAPGYVADGGFQPKIAFAADSLVPIPDGVSWEQGAAATDAGMTSYHAIITNGKAGPGKKIGAKGVAKSISEFADVEFDAIVDYAGFGTTTAEAIETVGRGGIVVQGGMGRLEATISTKALILSEVTLIGSQGGTKEDIAGVYEYLATGELEPTLTTIAFEDIPDGLAKLAKGEVVGRLVALY